MNRIGAVAVRTGALALAVLAAAGCSGGEVALADNPLLTHARIADYPRARLGSVPVRADEMTFGDRCGIELLQGATLTEALPDGTFNVDQPVTMAGWAFAPDEVSGIPEVWMRLLPTDPAMVAAEFPVVLHYPRPDVVAARSSDSAAYSGFSRVVVTDLPAGTYEAQVVFVTQAGRWVCVPGRRVQVR